MTGSHQRLVKGWTEVRKGVTCLEESLQGPINQTSGNTYTPRMNRSIKETEETGDLEGSYSLLIMGSWG